MFRRGSDHRTKARATDRTGRHQRRNWSESHRYGFEVQWLSSYFYPSFGNG